MSTATGNEPPLTLDERAVRTLGTSDQFVLWGNLRHDPEQVRRVGRARPSQPLLGLPG